MREGWARPGGAGSVGWRFGQTKIWEWAWRALGPQDRQPKALSCSRSSEVQLLLQPAHRAISPAEDLPQRRLQMCRR